MSKPHHPHRPTLSPASRPVQIGARPIRWQGWLAGATVSLALWGGIAKIFMDW